MVKTLLASVFFISSQAFAANLFVYTKTDHFELKLRGVYVKEESKAIMTLEGRPVQNYMTEISFIRVTKHLLDKLNTDVASFSKLVHDKDLEVRVFCGGAKPEREDSIYYICSDFSYTVHSR